MTKRRSILIASLSGLAGIILGMAIADYFLREQYASMTVAGWSLTTQENIVIRVALLGDIRSAQYGKASGRLEALVDSDIIGLASIADRGEKLSPNALPAIELERAARGVSGYQPTDPSMKALVDKAWRTLGAQINQPEK